MTCNETKNILGPKCNCLIMILKINVINISLLYFPLTVTFIPSGQHDLMQSTAESVARRPQQILKQTASYIVKACVLRGFIPSKGIWQILQQTASDSVNVSTKGIEFVIRIFSDPFIQVC